MKDHLRSRWRSTVGSTLAVATMMTVGCQTHDRRPLDLEQHYEDVRARLDDPEPIAEFVRRLDEAGRVAPASFDASDGLTPEEGEVLALFANTDLRLARMQAGVAKAAAEHAGLWDDPVFGFDATEIISSPSGPSELGFTVDFTIPLSGRLEAEREHAGAAHRAALERVVAAEWSTRAAVRRAWAAWVAAAERVDLLRSASTRVEQITVITDRLASAGELTRAEARLFALEEGARRAALVRAEHEAQQARHELLWLMGLAFDDGVELVRAYPPADLPRVEAALEYVLEHNATLRAHRSDYAVAEEALAVEVRKQYPDLTIGGGYGNEGDDRLLFGLSLPIPIFNGNRGGVAEALAEREVARATVEAAVERIVRELADAQQDYLAAERQRTVYEGTVLPLLTAQIDEVQRIAELGEVDVLFFLEVVSRQLDAKTRVMELHLERIEAAVTLIELFGPPPAEGGVS